MPLTIRQSAMGVAVAFTALTGCFSPQSVPRDRAGDAPVTEVRFPAPALIAIRASDSTLYRVTLVRGRLLAASATGDSVWIRPDSVVGRWRSAASGASAGEPTFVGPWVDRLLVTPASGEVRYVKRSFNRRKTLLVAGGIALAWVAYVAWDMIVNGPFEKS